MRDAVNPEEPGGGLPHRNPKVKAAKGWYLLLGIATAIMVAGVLVASG